MSRILQELMGLGKRPNWASDIIKIVDFGEGFVVFGSTGDGSWAVNFFVMGELPTYLTYLTHWEEMEGSQKSELSFTCHSRVAKVAKVRKVNLTGKDFAPIQINNI